MKKIILLFSLAILIFNFFSSKALCRNIRNKGRSPTFFSQEVEVKIVEDLNGQGKEKLNKNIAKYVLKSTSSEKILYISSPIPVSGESSIIRNYKFNIVTNKGKYVFYIKKVDKSEGMLFEKASKANIAPQGKYLPSGYIISKEFKGIKLKEIFWDRPKLLTNNDNYKWIFRELGKKTAKMKKIDILYRDVIHPNTLVNFKKEEIAIIDFQPIDLRKMPEVSLDEQIRILVSGLKINSNLKRKILNIFNKSYKTEKERD